MTNRKQRRHPCAARGLRVEKCGPTGKVAYRSEAAAAAALTLARDTAASQPRRHEQRCYPCQYAAHWHLTSEAPHPRRREQRAS